MNARLLIGTTIVGIVFTCSNGNVFAQAKNNVPQLRDVTTHRSGSNSGSTSTSSSGTEAGTRNTSTQTPSDMQRNQIDRNRVGDTLRPPNQ